MGSGPEHVLAADGVLSRGGHVRDNVVGVVYQVQVDDRQWCPFRPRTAAFHDKPGVGLRVQELGVVVEEGFLGIVYQMQVDD